jgi:hypothetical protein
LAEFAAARRPFRATARAIMSCEPLDREFRGTDRRRRPTRPWDVFLGRRRRQGSRRADEEGKSHFTDRFPRSSFWFAVLLLVLTIADGVITLVLLEAGCEEVNPLMRYFLNHGPMAFLLGKYLITAAFIPVTLSLNRSFVFGKRFRVGYLLPVFVLLYLGLILYQVALLKLRGGF